MNTFYTSEINTQMLICLMKKHGIKKVVASPGATNICFVASLQQDDFFELYSSVDERSAAYIACGLAAESGEPVALSCTGATASRNYIPGLTEAFYRKLPVLAVTSTQHTGRVGQYVPQVIDRSNPLRDIAKLSVTIPTIHDEEDRWAYGVMLNDALLELRHRGGGPVHINLTTTYSDDFSFRELPDVPVINRIEYGDAWPDLSGKRVCIFVGAHQKMTASLEAAIDAFCEAYDSVVICDHTSNYHGKYGVMGALVTAQQQYQAECLNMDVLIHIGEVSGAYLSMRATQVWRISPDGQVRDTFRKLRYVFEMREEYFFKQYSAMTDGGKSEMNTYKAWCMEYANLYRKIPALPFSNGWMAMQLAGRLPEGTVLHLGILNTLRNWNFFKCSAKVYGYANTGGFGIDGGVSSLLGAALAEQEKLYFGVVGDLAFFYDMNVLGNRQFGRNVRLLLINNGVGTEFKNYNHKAAKFGDDADAYMAAAGHYGNKSPKLVKHYAEDLGFEYMSASSKEEFLANMERWLLPELTDRPMLFEVFTASRDESDSLKVIYNLTKTPKGMAKNVVRGMLGEKGIKAAKKILGR